MPPIGRVGIIGDSSPIHIRKEIWDMYELTAIIKYESYKGNMGCYIFIMEFGR